MGEMLSVLLVVNQFEIRSIQCNQKGYFVYMKCQDFDDWI